MELFLGILVLISTSVAIVSLAFVKMLSEQVDDLNHEIIHLIESNTFILEHGGEVLEFNSKLIKELEGNENT